MAPVQNGGLPTIYNSKILTLWRTKTCFEIIHSLLVSVFDKVSKSKLFRFTAQYSSCNLQNAIFWKSQNCAKTKATSHIFLRATSMRQSGLFVYQITLKAYRMLQSYHLINSENIFKIFNWHKGKISRKIRGMVLHCQTTHGSLFNKSSHYINCSSNYVWLNAMITFCFNFQWLIFINCLLSR